MTTTITERSLHHPQYAIGVSGIEGYLFDLRDQQQRLESTHDPETVLAALQEIQAIAGSLKRHVRTLTDNIYEGRYEE